MGKPYVDIDTGKVIAIIESKQPHYPVEFQQTEAIDRKIAEKVIDFLLQCRGWFNCGKRLPPTQSGEGNVANSIVGEICKLLFEKIRF